MKKVLFRILKYASLVIGLFLLAVLTLYLYPSSDPLKQISDQNNYILLNANIVDVVNDSILSNQSILIEDNRIISIGHKDSISNTDAFNSVDCTGKYIIPGLWDMHTHLGFQVAPQINLPLHFAYGVTNIRDMHSIVKLNEERTQWRNSIESGGLLGPRIINFADEIVGANYDDQNVLEVVDRCSKDDRTFIKIYSQILSDRYFKLVEEANKKGVVFAGHYPNAINPIDASKAGQKSFEHAHLFFTHANPYADQLREYYRRYYSDDETASEIEPSDKEMFESFDSDMFYELVDVMIENETYYCPTHVTRRYEANSGNEAFTSDSNVKYIPPIALMIWKEDKAGIVEYMAKEDNEEHLEAYYLKGLELTGLAHERGLKIIAGTDCYDPYSFPGITLHTELKEMVKGGLTTAEALQTATVHAAEYFDVLDDYGTVEVNKIADLLILDKNPLENIENTRSIQYLFFNGDKYDKEDLNQIKNYVEDNASGLKGLSISVKMLARMASDNRH